MPAYKVFPSGRWQALAAPSAPTLAALRAALFATVALGACSLDDRGLARRANTTGAVAEAGTFGGGEAGAGGGGATGATPEAGGLIDGCADLDTDGVPDCEATLVENPTFATDTDGWAPVGQATLTWDERNALSDLPSGSAKLRGTDVRVSAEQCVPIDGRKLVIAYASALLDADANDGAALAELEVTFFQERGCSGTVDGYFTTPPSTQFDDWTTVQAGGLSSATTSSVALALVGVRAPSAAELTVYFDNVMLKTEEPR